MPPNQSTAITSIKNRSQKKDVIKNISAINTSNHEFNEAFTSD